MLGELVDQFPTRSPGETAPVPCRGSPERGYLGGLPFLISLLHQKTPKHSKSGSPASRSHSGQLRAGISTKHMPLTESFIFLYAFYVPLFIFLFSVTRLRAGSELWGSHSTAALYLAGTRCDPRDQKHRFLQPNTPTNQFLLPAWPAKSSTNPAYSTRAPKHHPGPTFASWQALGEAKAPMKRVPIKGGSSAKGKQQQPAPSCSLHAGGVHKQLVWGCPCPPHGQQLPWDPRRARGMSRGAGACGGDVRTSSAVLPELIETNNSTVLPLMKFF